jgi:hypothetical protein
MKATVIIIIIIVWHNLLFYEREDALFTSRYTVLLYEYNTQITEIQIVALFHSNFPLSGSNYLSPPIPTFRFRG